MPAASYLASEITRKGIPIISVSGPPWTVAYDPSATQAQKDQGDALAAAFDGKDRQPRPLWAIRGDVQALTTAQFNATWADLSAPVSGQAPRKYLMDYGPNASAIFVFDWALYVSGPTAAQQKAGQISLAAMYVQDNWAYLIQPAFDPSINISGLEPVS